MLEQTVQPRQLCLIGFGIADANLVFQNADKVVPEPCFNGTRANSICHSVCHGNLFDFKRWEIHFQQTAIFADGQSSTHGVKCNAFCVLFIVAEQYESRTQCSVSAKIDFAAGGKPAQMVVFPCFYGKCCFGKVVFHCDFQHGFIRWKLLQYTNRSGIAFKYFFCKSVNMITFHSVTLLFSMLFFLLQSS